jgi:hypothetical protein
MKKVKINTQKSKHFTFILFVVYILFLLLCSSIEHNSLSLIPVTWENNLLRSWLVSLTAAHQWWLYNHTAKSFMNEMNGRCWCFFFSISLVALFVFVKEIFKYLLLTTFKCCVLCFFFWFICLLSKILLV